MNIWEIWFADFPYEEDKTTVKPRPVIILNIEPLKVLSVKVTSQDMRTNDKFDIPIKNWQFAGLNKPSVARISKTMYLDKQNFKYKIGVLHDDDKIAIFNKYSEYLEEN